MNLTRHQQDMMEGKYGDGSATAMQIQIAIGESFAAERLIPISRAHVALSAQEADVWFAQKLLAKGARCSVFTTVNPGYCYSYFKGRGMVDDKKAWLMQETQKVYFELGATLTYSCTPYLFGNIPTYGEVVSFSETSASIYVNSVLGAKTHREGANSSLCAAITGYVPEYGMIMEENRFADTLIEVEADINEDYDFSMLGLAVGKISRGIPVFTGLPKYIGTEALIALGTQLNVSGTCDKYHIVGVTPGADTLEQALNGKKPQKHVVIHNEDLMQHRRSSAMYKPGEQVDFVMLGCPHYTYQQIQDVLSLLEDNSSRADIWIMTSAAVKDLASQQGLEQKLTERNVTIVESTCVDQPACWNNLIGRRGITDSPKCAYYMSSFGIDIASYNVGACIKWAIKGEVLE